MEDPASTSRVPVEAVLGYYGVWLWYEYSGTLWGLARTRYRVRDLSRIVAVDLVPHEQERDALRGRTEVACVCVRASVCACAWG